MSAYDIAEITFSKRLSSTFTGSGIVLTLSLNISIEEVLGGRALRGTKANPKNVCLHCFVKMRLKD